eukprot:TRINITY_DN23079_c0_g1_i1.p1 TRINITY_DN23079_c0_g1~~TRINITY_DN23079_c0_g1_i1.p1  ORF type:complete len:453 (-),score=88.21 TRINITY_DN23079_c0_g1_i1:50-1408(-)
MTMHSMTKTVVISTGLFINAYETFAMGMVLVILEEHYEHPTPEWATFLMTTSILVGAMAGQLLFGILGDYNSRKKMFVITIAIVTTFCIASSMSFVVGSGPYISLAIFRFFLGLGLGGEYPLSATIAAESSASENRGKRMAFIQTAKGLGLVVAPIVALVLLESGMATYKVWRVLLLLGAVPGFSVIYHRLHLPDPKHKQLFGSQFSESRSFSSRIRGSIKTLFGTSSTWMLEGFIFFSNNIFKEHIASLLGLAIGKRRHRLEEAAMVSLLIAGMAFPGYFLAIYLVDKIGRKKLQIAGFLLAGFCFLTLGIAYESLMSYPWIFVAIYGAIFFFANMGPVTTTYIISGEAFPEDIRATCSGISAAFGKIGAISGAAVYQPIQSALGIKSIFFASFGLTVLSSILTGVLIPEMSHKRLCISDDPKREELLELSDEEKEEDTDNDEFDNAIKFQ